MPRPPVAGFLSLPPVKLSRTGLAEYPAASWDRWSSRQWLLAAKFLGTFDQLLVAELSRQLQRRSGSRCQNKSGS
jgi:hypothetical protein